MWDTYIEKSKIHQIDHSDRFQSPQGKGGDSTSDPVNISVVHKYHVYS